MSAEAMSIWTVMMVGMMVPTAIPMFVRYSAVSRRTPAGHASRTVVFVLTYLALWAAFALAGSAAQTGLRDAGPLTHLSRDAHAAFAGAFLAIAGGYQLSPLKHACLRRCRSPLAFLLMEWRPGFGGALRLGLRHGVDCVLCCWALMAVMFVVGTMNLLWMGALTLVMFAEKVLPGGHRVGRYVGVGLLVCAVIVLIQLT